VRVEEVRVEGVRVEEVKVEEVRVEEVRVKGVRVEGVRVEEVRVEEVRVEEVKLRVFARRKKKWISWRGEEMKAVVVLGWWSWQKLGEQAKGKRRAERAVK
jgi:hypothetical protein